MQAKNITVYLVGGAVRDGLLGRTVRDRDWVVVGATIEDMLMRGFKPVGRDFPVFLHPLTHEEYALARTERKNGKGYKGFVVYAEPDVTLEEDLARRDLTINAMAQDAQGQLIDPFGGAEDLRAGVLRHVSPAFVEDPLRVLRVARFAARYGFQVAEETLILMKKIAHSGELTTLVAERLGQELGKTLLEAQPSRMLAVLAQSEALPIVLPEVAAWYAQQPPLFPATTLDGLGAEWSLCQRYALLAYGVAQLDWASAEARLKTLAQRLKSSKECAELAVLSARHVDVLRRHAELSAEQRLDLLQACDARRKAQRFQDLLQIATLIDRRCTAQEQDFAEAWQDDLARCRAVDLATIAHSNPPDMRHAMRRALLAALQAGA